MQRTFLSAVSLSLLVLGTAACQPRTVVAVAEASEVEPAAPAPTEERVAQADPTREVEALPAPGEAAPEDSSAGDPVAPAEGADDAAPTTDRASALARAFADLPQDPAPPEIIRNSHYWVSNESSHFLFRDRIRDIGGAYIGVGTDQNYLLAGWARSEFIIMMDFDQQIAWTHALYGIAFAAAATPADFLAIWRDQGDLRFADLVPAAVEDAERQRVLLRAFQWGGPTVSARLRRLVRQYTELGIDIFVTSQAEYDWIRDMWARGQVVAVRGDLTADVAMQEIAHRLHQHSMPVGLVYTSNAEQYFDFVPSFRRNFLVLPFAETSFVARTRPMASLGLAPGDEYHYSLQPGRNFQLWMQGSSVLNAQRLMRQRSSTGVEGLSIIDRPLPEDATPPRIAEARWPEDLWPGP
jgi:hypothetical protein